MAGVGSGESKLALIIDNGSYSVKAGYAGDEKPTNVFPTILEDQTESPLEYGIIKNWSDMEKVWHHTFYNQLKINPEEHAVFLTEAPLYHKTNREKMAQIMFETFHTPKMYSGIKSVMSLYASGRKTGIVVDSSHGASHIVPINDGYAVKDAILCMDLAGLDLTNYLMKILSGNNNRSITEADRKFVSEIKESKCYVVEDFEKKKAEVDVGPKVDTKYTLPDGRVITIGEEKFGVPEALFKPSFLGKESEGIHKLTFDSIQKCNSSIWNDMYKNIVLSGGSTMFEGFADRFKSEVKALSPSTVNVEVITPSPPKAWATYSSWIGGSILVTVTDFQDMWITKQEYEESGQGIVHRKLA